MNTLSHYLQNILNIIANFASSNQWYPYIPPIFAILTVVFSRGEDIFFERRIEDLCNARSIQPNLKTLLVRVAQSSAVLRTYITTVFTALITIVIAFHKWPEKYRYIGASLVIVSFLIFLRRWIWEISSLQLDEISGDSVPKKNPKPGRPPHHRYTYAKLLSYQQICFNISLIIIIFLGQWLSPTLLPVSPSAPSMP